MSERKKSLIAIAGLTIALLTWFGIQPEHLKLILNTFWNFIKLTLSWFGDLGLLIWDMLGFSTPIPLSLIIALFFVSFLAGKTYYNKKEINKSNHSLDTNDEFLELPERLSELLLHIYNSKDNSGDYSRVMFRLKIDTHMLDQAIEKLEELKYVEIISNYNFSNSMVVLTRQGRDIVIKYMESRRIDV
jgi:DNA-binding MarR family transcriptional regulator